MAVDQKKKKKKRVEGMVLNERELNQDLILKLIL